MPSVARRTAGLICSQVYSKMASRIPCLSIKCLMSRDWLVPAKSADDWSRGALVLTLSKQCLGRFPESRPTGSHHGRLLRLHYTARRPQTTKLRRADATSLEGQINAGFRRRDTHFERAG